jgi:hypothetical protein
MESIKGRSNDRIQQRGNYGRNPTRRSVCAAKRIAVMFNITGGISSVEIMLPPKH